MNINKSVTGILQDKVDEEKFDNSHLLVTHNMDAEKLIKSIEQYNGLLAPSLAISGLNSDINGFGAVTLVFDKDVLSNNGSTSISNTYDVDFYSEKFPETEYDLDRKYGDIFYQRVNDYTNHEIISSSEWDNLLKKDFEDFVGRLKGHSMLKYYYLNNNNDDEYDIPTKTKKIKLDKITLSKKLISILSKTQLTINSDIDQFSNIKDIIFSDIDYGVIKIRDGGGTLIDERIKRKEQSKIDISFNGGKHGINFHYLRQLLEASDILFNKKIEINKDKLQKDIDRIFKNKNITNDYNEFIDRTVNKIYINPHFKSGKVKKEFTEQNILHFFKRNSGVGKENNEFQSLGRARAMSAKKMTTFKSVYENRDELVSSIELQDIEDTNRALFHDFMGKLYDIAPARNDLHNDISENLGRSTAHNTDDDLITLFKDSFGIIIDSDLVIEYRKLHIALHTSKVDYFEAKPIKHISMDKVVGLVLPRNINKDLKTKIKALGIKIAYYDREPIKPNSRNKAIRSFKKHSINEDNVYKRKVSKKYKN
jgi:hypothetical protein